MRTKKSQGNKEEYMFSLIAEQATSSQSIKSFVPEMGFVQATGFTGRKGVVCDKSF